MQPIRFASFVGACSIASALVLPHAPAQAQPRPAPSLIGPTIVYEPATDLVLHADQPDQPWFPASLTKLMTAYVVFEAVKAGRLAWDAKVPLSEKARGQPATRIGLRLGIELTVEQAVHGMILRSANDFSMALAELVGDSEEGFVAMMNAAAKRLGMSRTTFANPHGLPDPAQISTARDMAILARALAIDFPDRTGIFSTPSILIHRQTFHNHNDLLRTLDGADGMKTGFTCGAGYNVVASATRDGRRVIVVVLGALNRQVRSEHAAALVEKAFTPPATAVTVAATSTDKSAPPVRLAALPMMPVEAVPVHDRTRETRSRKCGNTSRLPAVATATSPGVAAVAAAPVRKARARLAPAAAATAEE